MVICLDRVAALHMAQLMPLPLTSGVVVPERRCGKHFGAGTAFR